MIIMQTLFAVVTPYSVVECVNFVRVTQFKHGT